MSSLTDFLSARIAEDEAANMVGPEPEAWCDRAEGVHMDHARALAECEAKRKIVADLGQIEDACRRAFGPREVHIQAAWVAGRTLRTLATVYADHEDYDPSWRLT